MLTAIIVAGGSSQRMGFDKLLAPLGEKTVLAYSIAAFEQAAFVSEIVLVGRAGCLSEYEQIVRAQNFKKVVAIIPGGTRRQDSVRAGLEQINSANEFVAVHDAARPLVRPELVERILQLAQRNGGAASASPIIDTLKRVDVDFAVIGGVERAHLYAVETPQIFRRDLLEKAYVALVESALEVTDEISAVERIGGKVTLLPNDEPNFKITYPADLALAEFILTQR